MLVNIIFMLFFICGIGCIVYSCFCSHLPECATRTIDKRLLKFLHKLGIKHICKIGKLRRWAIFWMGLSGTWFVVKEVISNSSTIYTFAEWCIAISLIISFFYCIIMIRTVSKKISVLTTGKRTPVNVDDISRLNYIIVLYLAAFGVLAVIELFNMIGFFQQKIPWYDFCWFKMFYSLFYLVVYAGMSKYLISVYEEIQNRHPYFKEDIRILQNAYHTIDLPIAISFIFFFIIFASLYFDRATDVLTTSKGEFRFSSYFAIGGSALHFLISTLLFLYGYAHEFLGVHFYNRNAVDGIKQV